MTTGIHPIVYGTPQGASVRNAGEQALRAHRDGTGGIPFNKVFPLGARPGTLIGGAPDTQQ